MFSEKDILEVSSQAFLPMPTSTLLLIAREENKMAEKKHTVLQITLSAFQSWTLAILKSKILYRKVRNKLLICSLSHMEDKIFIYNNALRCLLQNFKCLTSDSYFSRVTQVNFPVPFFFPKQKW